MNGVSRRSVLVGLAAGTVGVLAACGERPRLISGPLDAPTAAASTPPLRTTWSNHPAGPIPAVGDEGHPLTVTRLGGAPAPVVRNGSLTADLRGAGAVYLTQQLPAPVRTIGARVGFGPGDPTGASFCLATWVSSPPPADTNCHLVFGSTRWIFSIAEGRSLVPLRDGPLNLPQDGSPQKIAVALDGGPSAVISLPDGTTETVVDPRIADIHGAVPGWEFFGLHAGGPALLLYESWAS